MNGDLKFSLVHTADLEHSEWARFIQSIERPPLFSTLSMLQAFEAFGFRVYVYIGRLKGVILFAVPFAVKKYGFLKLARGFPLSLYTGLLVRSEVEDQLKIQFLENLFVHLKDYSSASLCFDPFDEFVQGYLKKLDVNGRGAIKLKQHASVVAMQRDYDAIKLGYRHAVRKNIRQAHERGVDVSRVTSLDELCEFYKLASYIYIHYSKKMPYPFEFYKSLYAADGGSSARFLLARVGEVVVGGSVHIHNKTQNFNLLTVAYKAHNQYHSNVLLIDHEIGLALSDESCYYNLGASPIDGGSLESFKKSWGADSAYYYSYEIHGVAFGLLKKLRNFLQEVRHKINK